MKTANDFSPVPSPQAVVSEQSRRHITIGLPAVAAAGERRFPLTPEGAGMLVEKGFTVKIEAGAGAPIHYPDNAYAREGARICDRSGVLGCDIVISQDAPRSHAAFNAGAVPFRKRFGNGTS